MPATRPRPLVVLAAVALLLLPAAAHAQPLVGAEHATGTVDAPDPAQPEAPTQPAAPVAPEDADTPDTPGVEPLQDVDLTRVCPDPVPPAVFEDVAPGGTHATAIACLLAYGISGGVDMGAFDPAGAVTRGQLATFAARLLRAAGEVVEPPDTPRFDDVFGVHATNVEALAAMGIVRGTAATRYEPDRPVRRDQMPTILSGLLDHLTGAPLPDAAAGAPPHGFIDVPVDNVHASAIARLHAAGIVQGTSAVTFAPAAPVTREQMASFLLRTASVLPDRTLDPPSLDRAVVIAPETVVLSEVDRGRITAVDDDGIEFATLPSQLAPGQVLVAEPSPAAPDGLLHRITGIDGRRVSTAPAALTDAIHAGRATAERAVGIDDLAAPHELHAAVDLGSGVDGGLRIDLGDGIEVAGSDGHVRIRGDIDLGLVLRAEVVLTQRGPDNPDGPDDPANPANPANPAELTALELTLDGQHTSRLEVEALGAADADPGDAVMLDDVEVALLTAPLDPLVLLLDEVPVVVSPVLRLTLDAEGQLGVEHRAGLTHRAETHTRLRHTEVGGWSVASAWRPTFDGAEVVLTEGWVPPGVTPGAAQLRAGVGVGVEAAWFGAGAAALDLGSAMVLRATPQDARAWQLDAEAARSVAIDALAPLGSAPALARTAPTRRWTVAQAPPRPDPIRVSSGWVRAPGSSPVFGTGGTIVRYTVEIADGLTSRQDLEAFRAFVDGHLGHPVHGWTARGTVRLQRVDDASQARIRILLARPATVDRLCAQAGLRTGGYFSCWNGRFAVLNSDRWFHSVPHVPDLALYRGYLVNHEVGHGLGHGHRACPGPGQIAPVMMQLSKSTYGCVPNPYPYP